MPKPLPKYVCHKEVQALKIQSVRYDNARRIYLLKPVEDGFEELEVPADWQDRHGAKPGTYYVVYKDGYASISPAAAFEEGYTAVP